MAQRFAKLIWIFSIFLLLCGCSSKKQAGQSAATGSGPNATAAAVVELPPPFQDPGVWEYVADDDQQRSVDPAANAVYIVRRYYRRPRGEREEWSAGARHMGGKEAGRWLYVHWTVSGERRPDRVVCVHSHDAQGRAADFHELKDDEVKPWTDASRYTRKVSKRERSDPDRGEAVWIATVGYYEGQSNELAWVAQGSFNAAGQPIGEWRFSAPLAWRDSDLRVAGRRYQDRRQAGRPH
jgi:hypothetical protein